MCEHYNWAACLAACLQYMYNLKTFGHKMYSRRDPAELGAAEKAVSERVSKGELGGLSPL